MLVAHNATKRYRFVSVSTTQLPHRDPRIARSRRKVLASATEILVESGPRAVTVDAVAERSGVAKSTIYRHWDSRSELLVDVIRAHVPVVNAPTAESFEAALRDTMRELVHTMSDPDWGSILPAIVSLKRSMPDVAKLAQSDDQAKLEVVRTLLNLGVAEGRFGSPDVPAPTEIETMHLLAGPILMATLSGNTDILDDLGDRVVQQFLARYPQP